MINSSFKQYTSYKDSGFDWLGKIPTHWEIRRLKEISKLIIDGTHITPDYIDGGVHFLSINDITRKPFDLAKSKFISSSAHQELSKRCLPKKGDILLSKNGTIGVPFLIDFDDEVSIYVSLCLIRLKVKSNSRYAYYSFLATFMFEQYNLHSKMTSVTNLHLDKLRNFFQLLPPPDEQQAIAEYLDAKVTQIDRKIELLEQKAEKYADLKQSLINETVTRGLDKTVPMKDSEVKWIGQIPTHWEVKRIKDLFVQSKNKVGSKSNLFKVLSLTQNGVIERDIENGKGKFPATFDGYQIVVPDSILLCLFDMDVTPRIIGYVDQIGLATSAYTSIVGSKDIFSKYYYYYFLNQDRNKSLLANGKGLRSTLTFDNFGLLRIPFPPLEEQKAIAEYLEVKTVQIEKIIETINLEVEKLEELRKTLINDVVTGKIKVYEG